MRELPQLQLEGDGGDEELIDVKVKRRRLEWLGHIARMLITEFLSNWFFKTTPSTGGSKEKMEGCNKTRLEGHRC